MLFVSGVSIQVSEFTELKPYTRLRGRIPFGVAKARNLKPTSKCINVRARRDYEPPGTPSILLYYEAIRDSAEPGGFFLFACQICR